ncbi:unnamed protein product [Phytophthora fragariaefolia]|uniref:Unnamed protein product n=1 Tax=Phytophthora fragariaefolia TaxID=1490495 RepID=A0A9W6X4U4_9STRA|nr:unnamed protein product [Phytophthora fragariaefolia]
MVKHGAQAVQLGHGDIYTQCRDAIALLCRRGPQPQFMQVTVVQEFMQYWEVLAQEWCTIAAGQPQKIWTQGQGKFPTLSSILVKVYTAPGSTAGVERHHKVARRVHSAARNRIGAGKEEKQVSVVHNAAVAKLKLRTERQRFETHMV